MYKQVSVIIFSFFLIFNVNAQWYEQEAGFDTLRAIGHICAVDTNTVWACAYDPNDPGNPVDEYTKTIDGGNTWVNNEITGADTLQLSMIYALDKDLAYASLYSIQDTGGVLMKTVDGGNTWSKIDSVSFVSDPKLVYFWNENEGVVVADPDSSYFQIYTTDDGGNSWEQVEMMNMPISQQGELTTYKSYSVVGDTFRFGGVTFGKVYVSYDRGKNWSFLGTPLNNVTKVIFKDSVNGIIGDVSLITNSWELYATMNAGLSWSAVDPIGSVGFNDICFVPGSPNAYVSAGYSLSQSNNGANSWTLFDHPNGGISPYYTNLAFVNPTTGWSGGVNFNNNSGGIYKYYGTPLSSEDINYKDITLDIYPNPGNGFFYIDLQETTVTTNIEVYNMIGKQVFSTQHYTETIDLSHLKSGIYLIKLMIDDNVFQQKIIIRNP